MQKIFECVEKLVEQQAAIVKEIKWQNKYLAYQFQNLYLRLPAPRYNPDADIEDKEFVSGQPWRYEDGKWVD